jgi:starch synthase (maltosyl-transferring)
VYGSRAAFRIRLLLAATLLPLYGIYSGYELAENIPVRLGSEEYLDSEKYQLRPRDFDTTGNIDDDITRINAIRRSQRSLQRYANLSFHTSENPAILFYRKAPHDPAVQWTNTLGHQIPPKIANALDLTAARGRDMLIAVTLNPEHPQETMVHVPIWEMGIGHDQPYVVHDLLTDARYTWRGVRNYVRLDPNFQPGHVFVVERV